MNQDSQAVGKYQYGAVVFFFLIHIGALTSFLLPFCGVFLWWLAGTYALRMFGVTAGYHRYFSHRSYKLSCICQFLLAFLAQTSGHKGVLWWAAHHHEHHRHSDQLQDFHSPWQKAFCWAHVGWILSNEYDEYNPRRVADFGRFPELRWLDRHYWVPTVCFGAAVLFGGRGGFVWGFLVSTVLLYHGTLAINSFAHVFGRRRFNIPDQSRNNWPLALITFGEGWHNNHHYSMSSCRQGFHWWEIDMTYYVLRLLNLIGIVRELRPFRLPPLAGQGTA